MLLFDRMTVTTKRKLADGRLAVDARFARAGIYHYTGREVDPDNENGLRDQAVVRVYRPPEAIFDTASMASFAFKAVTDDHPSEMVTADNWQSVAKGFTGGEVARDGDFVRMPMMLSDAGLIAKVDDGKSELSAGYDATITFGLGFTPRGEAYDAVMGPPRGNHIAVVDAGRAGHECRIADTGVETMTVATKVILVDGLNVTVTDDAERAILKLQDALKASAASIETLTAQHATAIAAKDSELGTKDAEIADLKGKVLTDEALDAKVAERATLLADVAKVADGIDTKGKTVPEIRRAAVLKALGDGGAARLDGKSDDYVSALFDGLLARASDGGNGGRAANDGLGSVIADTLPGGGNGGGGGNDAAYRAMIDRRGKAWQNPGQEDVKAA